MNTKPGFTATHGNAHCAGSHHRDRGRLGRCDACGRDVVKTDKGRVLTASFSGGGAVTFTCWSQSHTCDPNQVAAYGDLQATQLANGDIIKGQTVVVAKGRKVPKGTTGTITWIGEDNYGKARVGIRTDDGETVFTAQDNVEAI